MKRNVIFIGTALLIGIALWVAGCAPKGSGGQGNPTVDGGKAGNAGNPGNPGDAGKAGNAADKAGNAGNAAVAEESISAKELKELLERDKDVALIFVGETYRGEIPGTTLLIPGSEMEQNLGQLPPKNKRIVVYDPTGRMSSMVANRLRFEGYQNVSYLEGGLSAWQAAGYPVTEREVSDKYSGKLAGEFC